MNIVIPMAGRGARFREAGFSQPKPLIPVLGRPMYAWAVDSLPLALARRLVFVCLAEHLATHDLADDIRARYPDHETEIIALDKVTEGQLCTVLEARALIDESTPLLVYNADTWCRTSLEEHLPALDDDVEGLLGVFRAEGDHWSFARTDASGRVVETAEKRRISPWATTGLYWFRDGSRFVAEADAMIADDDRVRGEFYVAPLYNRLINAGARIVIDEADEVGVMGTPAELEDFVAHHADQ